ncbi:hypothetical protein EON63_06325 [archaeon]|nr:MAG: hypothetical protein EON63_06325 [archaeon]
MCVCVCRSIREVDDISMVFFAAVTWDDIVPAGFEHAPDNNSVFAFHYYEPPQAVCMVYMSCNDGLYVRCGDE